MLSRTPPMGWNTWNTFGGNINEELLLQTADIFVSEGLKDVGYEYIVIDDCWSKLKRENGKLVADPEKFPHGMKYVADYIHSKGLKFGMYSCAGTRTCAGYPGSYDYEFIDAQTFADWGVDFLKYDSCFVPENASNIMCYKKIGVALRAASREILFSACNWGAFDCGKWMRAIGAHMWRSTGDIQDNWESIKRLTLEQLPKLNDGAMASFNDMDMLVCGMYGKGNAALGGCSDDEYKTHFSLWALLNSPLMIGCDIREMTQSTKDILLNKNIIAINQDKECRQPFLATNYEGGNERLVFVKPLENDEYAIGFFNLSDNYCDVILNLYDMGLPSTSGYGLQLWDVWENNDAGIVSDW
ncbi:MAG: glycoside hydrolase family 27 protein, partial [Oscillospiraceae bacterium]